MKRVLSIDGGGIKGAFAASFLSSAEEALGRSVADYFDIIVGTSTGGIIALGLGLGLSARVTLDLYRTEGPRIFARRGSWGPFRQFFNARYQTAPLSVALENVFGTRLLGESRKRLVIPSFNLETGDVYNWKTSHHPRLENDYKARVVEVALATAAAPTYFPTHRTSHGVPLIDGGVWANNPIAVAAVEAVGVLGWQRDELYILSVGCTTSPFGIGMARFRSLGTGYWVWKITDLFMAAQSGSALGMAQHLVSDKNRVTRICPVVGNRFRLDSVAEIPSLIGLGHAELRNQLPRLRESFFREPLADEFIPCHRL